MHLRLDRSPHAAVLPLLALAFMAIGLPGCGDGDGDATTSETGRYRPVSQDEMRPRQVATNEYMERRFGNETWYPKIEGIYLHVGSMKGTATVRTYLHGQNGKRNKRMAEEICAAVISAPFVDKAGVFYDTAGGGSTAQCP